MAKRKKKVVVAMSGGVDSSLTACLLKEQGLEVIGLTMKLIPDSEADAIQETLQYNESTPAGRSRARAGCCSYLETGDARQVAQKLRIPHYVLDLTKEFEKKVINDFCSQYLKGRTPNPCIRCNQHMKFELLLNKARQLDADYIATGHYAAIEYCADTKKYLLKKGRDKDKDQSYALFTMTQEQLKSTLLPLGGLTKTRVRKLAREAGLCVHDKADSQEICFVTDNDYNRFLKSRYKELIKPGEIIGLDGRVLSRHQGSCFYTIGQRRGLGIAAARPLYVVKINPEENKVVVGEKEDLLNKELTASDVNWIHMGNLKEPLKVKAKIRYNQRESAATVMPVKINSRAETEEKLKIKKTTKKKNTAKHVKVKFHRAQSAITPGQAVVFYDKDVVLGGGWID